MYRREGFDAGRCEIKGDDNEGISVRGILRYGAGVAGIWQECYPFLSTMNRPGAFRGILDRKCQIERFETAVAITVKESIGIRW